MVAKKCFFAVLLFAFGTAGAQKIKKEDRQLFAGLQQHIQFLSDDKLEGRRTGTIGEKMAAEYIKAEFSKIGLQPKGTADYLQPFEINEGREIHPSTALSIDGKKLVLQKDFFPMAWSPALSIEALPSLALQEPDMPWFFDLKELIETNASNPHFDLNTALVNKAGELRRKGATVLFVYNTGTKTDGLRFDARDRTAAIPIPVIYLSQETMKPYLADPSSTLDIKLKTEIMEKVRKGSNVVGYIDNGAATTVILGAHFDHLGFGEDGNSREVEKKKVVHNGADDNASGTAALIELARQIRASKLKQHNYLFIAFSGEELGLYGSKHFTQNPSIDLASVNYMINMDMIGRLNDSTRTITVGGYGTSPSWGAFYTAKGKNRLESDGLAFRYDSSGTGPSDHTSFYLKNIPVLFYFTGLHTDYHKPTDDANKINYLGTLQVVKHIYSVVQAADKHKARLSFTKTREVPTTTTARFSVTLGIMPDYTFPGAGVRVDGVSENRPAQKAGLKAGDVITMLGEQKISSVESYMQALSSFKKGDKTTVAYTRGSQTFSTTVEF